MTTISAIARTTATAIVPQNITLGPGLDLGPDPLDLLRGGAVVLRLLGGRCCPQGWWSLACSLSCRLKRGADAREPDSPRTNSPLGPYQESGTDADERQAVDLDLGSEHCR